MSKCIIFSAPSGAGKTTIVRYLLGCNLNLEFSISACSRPKRGNEYHGRDYYFLSIHEFKRKAQNNEFIEWEEVYQDNFYGTLKSEIDRIWNSGKFVIFDVDVQGGINLKRYFGDRALSVFVMPPSVEQLEKRLRARNTDSEESLKKRIDKAESELSFSKEFDFVLLNDDLETACKQALEKVKAFLK
jgi:guanylate kinase